MSHVEGTAPWYRHDIQSGKWDKKKTTRQTGLNELYARAIARLWKEETEGVALIANYGRRPVLAKEYVGKTLKAAKEKLETLEFGSSERNALFAGLKRMCEWFCASRNNLIHCPIRRWIELAVMVGQSDDEMAPFFR